MGIESRLDPRPLNPMPLAPQIIIPPPGYFVPKGYQTFPTTTQPPPPEKRERLLPGPQSDSLKWVYWYSQGPLQARVCFDYVYTTGGAEPECCCCCAGWETSSYSKHEQRNCSRSCRTTLLHSFKSRNQNEANCHQVL